MMLTDLNSKLNSLVSQSQLKFDKTELLLLAVENSKPSNKRLTTQRSFFSTRKKRKPTDTTMKWQNQPNSTSKTSKTS